MLKTTVGKVVAIVLAVVVVGGAAAGFFAYRYATPWLAVKDRLEELKDCDYSFDADVELVTSTFLPECKVRGDKQELRIHGDVITHDQVLTDVYAGVGETTYINTRYVTQRFMASLKESLNKIPIFGEMAYQVVESQVPTGDRYMTLDQAREILALMESTGMEPGAEGTSYSIRTKTYTSKDETAWGTYEVQAIDGIESMPQNYDVESTFFRVTFSNGNQVEISIPKDANEKSDYMVVRTAAMEAHILLHYNIDEHMSELAYPTESDFDDKEMENLRTIFDTIKQLQ